MGMPRRRASVFQQETIPSLVDRYTSKPPDLNTINSSSGKEPIQLPTREPLPIRQPLLPSHDPLLPLRYEGDTFAERFGSYSRMKVDNFAQCEVRMQQLQEEHAWLHDRLNRLAAKVEDYARHGGGFGYGGRGYMGNGYPHLGGGGWGGYNNNLDGRGESFSYMESVRERERQNIVLEKDRMEYNLSAQRHHGRAERAAPFNEDWDESGGSNMYRSKQPDFGDDGPREAPPREKMVERVFTRKKEERPPAEAKPKRTRKISSFKI